MSRQLALSLLALALTLSSTTARATKTRVHALETSADFASGEFDGTSLLPDGTVVLGPTMKRFASEVPGPVLALATMPDGSVYVATAAPGRVFRVFEDKAPELVVELTVPLVTALVPMGPNTLVALGAPDSGVHFITLGKTSSVSRTVAADGVKFLLGAVADGETLYVVGGGDAGVLLELAPGAKAFTTLATVKEKTLRSVARAPVAGRRGLVVGGADDGIVYLFDGKTLRALVDAEPGEVSALAVDAKGRIFAALVDAQGKVTDGATARDAAADEKEGAGKAKPKDKKPRKVKSAEVLRIDPDGSVHVLWQSKAHGAYALALDKRGVVVGTGGTGQVLLVDPEGRVGATVLGRAEGGDEVVAFARAKSGALLLGTAHSGSVVSLDATRRTKGTFTTRALDARAVARYGHVAWAGSFPAGSRVSVDVRTGGTAEPDDTWSAFSPALSVPSVPLVPAARFAQVRVTLEAPASVEPSLALVRLAFLTTNRPPEISDVEVVAPGWRVKQGERERPESRSVSFGKGAFKKYEDARGSAAPVLEERPSGKQSPAPGHRTVYAFVEDPDGDALRYRFSLARVDQRQTVGAFVVVKDWSDEPFVSLDMARLKDGGYRVRIETDDAPTNGHARALGDVRDSPVFEVAHDPPRFALAKATPGGAGVRLELDVEAKAPLTLVACTTGGGEWFPVDPTDGILDTARERFDVVVPGVPRDDALKAASCTASDEAGNEARVDLSW